MRRRLIALGVLFAAVFGVGLMLAGPASAHASVVSSDPVDGSRLKAAPAQVTITFDESVGLGGVGYLHVTDQSGRRVDAGAAFHPSGDGSKIADKLNTGLSNGTYTGSFRVISADSHPVAGSIRFVVGNGVLSPAASGSSTVNHLVSIAFDAARWVSYTGVALMSGAWLLLTVWPQGRDDRRARQIVWTGLGMTAVGAAAELVLQGPYSAGSGLAQVTNWSLLDGTLHTDYGTYHCARLVLLGLVAVVFGWALQAGRQRSRGEGAAPLLGIGLALTFSAVGHPATTSPVWLSTVGDLLHISAMGAWLGGLVMLLAAVLPRHEPAELDAVLPMFSKVAFGSITVLAVTGTYSSWRGIGELHAIFTTSYGLLVVLKVVLFVALLAVANMSRMAVQRRLGKVPVAYAMADPVVAERGAGYGEDRSSEAGAASVEAVEAVEAVEVVETERLRRAVWVEVVLALAVLVATSVLVAQPRGKEAVATAQLHAQSGSASLGAGRSATVTVNPGRHGLVSVAVALSPGVTPIAVTATASLPSAQLGPIAMKLSLTGADTYQASAVNLPSSGHWQFSLVVATSQFDATTTTVTVRLY